MYVCLKSYIYINLTLKRVFFYDKTMENLCLTRSKFPWNLKAFIFTAMQSCPQNNQLSLIKLICAVPHIRLDQRRHLVDSD